MRYNFAKLSFFGNFSFKGKIRGGLRNQNKSLLKGILWSDRAAREAAPQRVKCVNPGFMLGVRAGPSFKTKVKTFFFFLFLFVLSKKILVHVASTLAASALVTSTLTYCNFRILESLVGTECDCWLAKERVMWRAQAGESHSSVFK